MNTTVDLVLASTVKSTSDPARIFNFFTFRIAYTTTNAFRKLLRRGPRTRTFYVSDSTPATHLALSAIYKAPDLSTSTVYHLIKPQVDAAVAAFEAIHSNGRISVKLIRTAKKLWGSRVNDVLKFKRTGEYHVPSWDGINLTGDIAQATENGWIRTTKGN